MDSRPVRSVTSALLALVCLCVFVCARAELRARFVDVGHGDCTLLTSAGKAMLIDTGGENAWEAVTDALEAEKVEAIDDLVLTHPHADHIGNARRILERYAVKRVILPQIEYATDTYNRLLAYLEKTETPRLYPVVGEGVALGETRVSVYAPHPVAYANENDWSIVLKVEYGGRSLLLCADAQAQSGADMLANQKALPLDADILRVGHHGSDTSSTFAFVSAVAPKYAVVSCDGGDDLSTDVAMTLMECGARDIFTTAAYGDIVAQIAPDGAVVLWAEK